MEQQNWVKKFSQWARSGIKPPEISWGSFGKGECVNIEIRSLKLQDLCCPVFQVDPVIPKRVSEDRLHKIWDNYSRIPDPPSEEDVNSLLDDITESGALSQFPEFDLIYVAKALALARLSHFAQAEAVLETAFRKCHIKSALCKANGDIKLWQAEIVAFGWYMQSCLLGYESYLPYLQLSQAAKAVALEELSNRLINASDIVGGTSMCRLSRESATRTTAIAKKDVETLHVAFEKFLGFANNFLPPSDIFPPDNENRNQWLSICSGDPEGTWLLAKKRIIERCSA